jgi:hypothetical protein
VKAHRSGICASYAIADPLTCGIYLGLAGYRRYTHQQVESHSRAEAKYHSEEHHWPQSEFWRKRHAS